MKGSNRTAVLAVLLAGAGLPGSPAIAQTGGSGNEPPDVGVAYDGAGAAPNLARFKVTSRRAARTPAVTVTIETLAPYPANKQTFQVPSLATRGDAHELAYTLDGPRNGHRVRATIDVKDANDGNNRAEAEVCKMGPTPGPTKPLGAANERVGETGIRLGNTGPGANLAEQATDTGARVGPAGPDKDTATDLDVSAVPDYLRPGQHTEPFEPVATKNQEVSTLRWVREPSRACRDGELAGPARPSSVGFRNFDTHDDDCTWHQYFQLALRFDFSDLRGHSFVPVDATLRFREQVYEELDEAGQPVSFEGFVRTRGIQLASPTGSWDAENARYLGISYEDTRDQSGIGVFAQIQDLVTPMIQNAGIEKDGLMLIGRSEEMNNDRAACMPEVSNVELTFTYVIPDR